MADSKSGPLHVCFVGCGNIAKYHVDAAAAAKRVKVTCFVDPLEAKRSELKKLAVSKGIAEVDAGEFDSLEACLSASSSSSSSKVGDEEEEEEEGASSRRFHFEAVVIMVPSFLVEGEDLHEKVASLAIRAQRHVLLEKPMCVSAAAAERLIQLHEAEGGGKVFAVAENAQFWPEILEALKCIESGAIGEVLTARAKFYESAGGPWAGDYLPDTWRCDASKLPSASFTFDGTSHWLRPLRLWLGEVDKVVGLCGRTLEHMPGASMSQHLLHFKSGKTAIFESLLAPKVISDQPFFTIQGTLGELVLDGFDGGCHLHRLGDDGEKQVQQLCHKGWDEGYVGEWADFLSATLDGCESKGDARQAVEDLRVLEAMFRSSETLAWESVR